MRTQLVDAGTARAHSLGWPDAYPFTKAMGERVLVQQWAGTVPITFVRPSIIESALSEPRPGWIRGFRMAEPIIVSYARGLLREFPGVPEGIIDVIPVDLVVAAILAVAAHGPGPRRTVGVPRGLGRAEPVPLRAPGRAVRGLVQPQPALRRTGAADQRARVVVPGPGPGAAPTPAGRSGHDRGRAALDRAAGAGQAGRAGGAHRGPPRPGQAGPRLRRALRGLHRDRRPLPGRPAASSCGTPSTRTTTQTFCFDPGVIDWDHYVHNVHLPSVVEHARVRTTAGRSVVEKRPERARKAILSADRHLAVFDLEHTLMASNVVDTYAWLASRHLPAGAAGQVRGRPGAPGAVAAGARPP